MGLTWAEMDLERELERMERGPLCDECGRSLANDDYYYDIDGERMCEDCATDWLKNVRRSVEDELEVE